MERCVGASRGLVGGARAGARGTAVPVVGTNGRSSGPYRSILTRFASRLLRCAATSRTSSALFLSVSPAGGNRSASEDEQAVAARIRAGSAGDARRRRVPIWNAAASIGSASAMALRFARVAATRRMSRVAPRSRRFSWAARTCAWTSASRVIASTDDRARRRGSAVHRPLAGRARCGIGTSSSQRQAGSDPLAEPIEERELRSVENTPAAGVELRRQA